jgi:hypothetical protein
VLVTGRSAIDACLAELLLRRGRQEKTPGISAKILSIGQQMGIDGMPEGFFGRLGMRAEELNDESIPKLVETEVTPPPQAAV